MLYHTLFCYPLNLSSTQLYGATHVYLLSINARFELACAYMVLYISNFYHCTLAARPPSPQFSNLGYAPARQHYAFTAGECRADAPVHYHAGGVSIAH
jgi:hypothetical protein